MEDSKMNVTNSHSKTGLAFLSGFFTNVVLFCIWFSLVRQVFVKMELDFSLLLNSLMLTALTFAVLKKWNVIAALVSCVLLSAFVVSFEMNEMQFHIMRTISHLAESFAISLFSGFWLISFLTVLISNWFFKRFL